MTQEEKLISLLKQYWLSAYQMQQMLKSSSADRTMRRIRKNPPGGWIVIDRKKDIDGYNKCLEYHLVKEDSQLELF